MHRSRISVRVETWRTFGDTGGSFKEVFVEFGAVEAPDLFFVIVEPEKVTGIAGSIGIGVIIIGTFDTVRFENSGAGPARLVAR